MLTCRPGQIRAYLRAEFLYKVEFLTRPGAAAALPSSLAAGRPGLRLFAPPPRPAGRGARPPEAGRFVGPPGRNNPAPPLRGRAPPLPPLAARPAPTTATLQEKRYTASYASGVALCPSLARRASAPLARPGKETEPVMGEFNSGKKSLPPDLLRVSQKLNLGFPPLVVEL